MSLLSPVEMFPPKHLLHTPHSHTDSTPLAPPVPAGVSSGESGETETPSMFIPHKHKSPIEGTDQAFTAEINVMHDARTNLSPTFSRELAESPLNVLSSNALPLQESSKSGSNDGSNDGRYSPQSFTDRSPVCNAEGRSSSLSGAHSDEENDNAHNNQLSSTPTGAQVQCNDATNEDKKNNATKQEVSKEPLPDVSCNSISAIQMFPPFPYSLGWSSVMPSHMGYCMPPQRIMGGSVTNLTQSEVCVHITTS
jgi:hypothetical protein